MKLRNLFAAAALGLVVSCETPYEATDTAVIMAPDGVHTAFIAQYPTASNVIWTHYDPAVVVPIDWELAGWTVLDAADYAVTFDMDNADYYAWYDEDGTWIGTTYVVRDFSTLPTVVSNAAYNLYPGYTITAVNREFQKDRIAYEIEMKNSDTKVKMLVDANGNVIKQKTKALY